MNAFEYLAEQCGGYVFPEKYVLREDGVFFRESDGLICVTPAVPTAIFENLDTGAESVEISFIKRGVLKKILVERKAISNRADILSLANRGLEVNCMNAGEMAKYFAQLIALNQKSIPFKKSRAVLGWCGNRAFLPYDDEICIDGNDVNGEICRHVRPKGELQAWLDYVGELRRNSLPFRLCIAASFASPLIELVGENPFVFHLWGGTGSGKTVALMGAMSIWGDPAPGRMLRTMNMTPNSMMTTAATLKNIPFGGDELQTIKDNWSNYDRLVMQITEGIERGRMKYDRVNETRNWKCAFLFTGEEPCTKNDSGGGAKNRVIEIECREKLVGNGNEAANFFRDNYGTAGRRFVEALICMNDEGGLGIDIPGLYKDYFAAVMKQCNTTQKQAGAMALILSADLIASQLFWDAADNIMPEDVRQWLKTNDDIDIAENAYKYLCEAIAENVNSFDRYAPHVWGILDKDKGKVFINTKIARSVLEEAGYDINAVKHRWEERGYIKRDGSGKFRQIIRINGICTSCYCLVLPDNALNV